jgi:NO-binding membrane sensor protein with MHYT domain
MIHVNNFSNGALNPVLAYLVSCVGCFLGLRCTTRARAYQGAARGRWLTLAALAIATTGIWVMHFIAMLGFTIPGETIRYDVPVTILSMVIAVVVVGIGTFIVGFSRAGPKPLLAGGLIIGIGVASMHYLGMAAIRVPDSLTYNPALVAASVVIAVIAGTAALWAALRLDTLWSTIVASLIMGVAVSGMHYTGMAALRVQAAPGLVVSTSATASAAGFLLPLIIGLSSIGFIFSALIALSPTAAEIFEEDEVMKRISQSQAARYEPQARTAPQPAGSPAQSRPAQSRPAQSRPAQSRPAQSRPAQAGPAQAGPAQAGPVQPDHAQPGSLFRPHRPTTSGERGEPPARLPHRRTLSVSQERRGPAVRKNETTRSLAEALSSQGSTGHCFHAVSPL